ncbi:HDOD domain-containing protein [Marinagarivorans algicola]|uniref:HDOD domain-containing protein n=1 Tax=Marinagarivorans algicola TaxID=1513270 RepID=UPI0006B6392C|nr:HDOD domain-containing protein [Marinagarivorans algicola]
MPLPASILQMLETNNIHYELRESLPKQPVAASAQACLVKSLLLKDSKGIVQVLLPWNRMLNLDAVANEFNRNLTALSQEELAHTLSEVGLTAVPAIPQWQKNITLVDSALLEFGTLWLETGDHEQMLEVKREVFCAMVTAANVASIASAVSELLVSSVDDDIQIAASVQRFTQLRIKQRLEDTLELPPLPDTARRIIKLRANPEADISDLTDIVELDPSLAAQVVSWAASPYYSAPGKIKSVHDAIVRVLGFDMVLNLALGLALGKTMSTSVMSQKQIAAYWQHAICVAAVVEGLVTSIPREHRPAFGMSYLAGLLCNFGHLILAEVFPPYYANISRHLEANPHIQSHAVEQSIVGVSSCQISSWLLETWSMPSEVITALRQQFNPSYQGEHAEYAHLLFVAEQLLARRGIGSRLPMPIPSKLFESLHLDPETAEATVGNVLESCEALDDIAAKMMG